MVTSIFFFPHKDNLLQLHVDLDLAQMNFDRISYQNFFELNLHLITINKNF